MATEDILILFAEVSVALGGFSGVVGVLGPRSFAQWSRDHRVLFANLIVGAFAALFWSIVPLILLNAGVDPELTWILSSGLWVPFAVPANLVFWKLILVPGRSIPAGAIVQTAALVVVVVLQIWNVVSLRAAWPFLVAISLMLASGATAFVLFVVTDSGSASE